jgi:hypothetical protein
MWPGQSFMESPHVKQRLRLSTGPMAGSYSPPCSGLPSRSYVAGVRTRTTLSFKISSSVYTPKLTSRTSCRTTHRSCCMVCGVCLAR